ncbi:molybdopterin-guanine dinucleotide biosynthesis protein B [Utexia brackfieldae]|uniref:molybdopterin-guanine dinucleotide biosynthesis protein B n=1 Tax=Utexia brackfieldae TaxID=3074108 RepID=UPI00370D4ABD
MKVLAVCGYSGSGKTTLLTRLLPQLKAHQIRIGVIKHAHHEIEIDKPGKDSYQLRQAGAEQTILASDKRWALMVETPNQSSIDIKQLIAQFTDIDLVFIEGFKDESIDKLIVHRQANQKPLFMDDHTLAVIADCAINTELPVFALNDIVSIKQFILSWLTNS